MAAVEIAPDPVLVLRHASTHLWRWDIKSVDNPSHVACSIVWDDRLEDRDAVYQRVTFIAWCLNSAAST